MNTRPAHYECAALPTELFQHQSTCHAAGKRYYYIIAYFCSLSSTFKKIIENLKNRIEIKKQVWYNKSVENQSTASAQSAARLYFLSVQRRFLRFISCKRGFFHIFIFFWKISKKELKFQKRYAIILFI